MIEIIGIIFSLLSVWLSAKKSIWTWPIGIIGVIAYGFIFQEDRDWNNLLLQFIFLAQSIYGWVYWNRTDMSKISKLHTISRLDLTAVMVITGFILYTLTYLFNGNSMVLDTVTATLSIFGMFLLAHKKIENWILWGIADILYIGLFIENKHYMSSGLYFIFLLIAIWGFVDWKKQLGNGKS